MKKVISIILSIALAASLLMTFAACDGNKKPANPTEAPAASEEPSAEATAEATAAPTTEPTAAPSEDPTTPPDVKECDFVEKWDTAVLDFNGCSNGDVLDDTALNDVWEFGEGNGTSVIAEEDGSCLALIKYDSIYTKLHQNKGTTYNLTFKARNEGAASQFGGFVLNWSDECELNRNFSENNGLRGDGQYTLTGHSGIGFTFNNNDWADIYFCTFDEATGLFSAEKITVFMQDPVRDNFYNYEINDNGTEVSLKINDKLIATIKYENEQTLAENVNDWCGSYFRTATVYDGNGEQIYKVEKNAMISSYKSVAIGGRNHWYHVDDIKFN